MESSSVVVRFGQAETNRGEYRLAFATHTAAESARTFFLASSLYRFRGSGSGPADYAISGGYILLAADATDTEYAAQFAVVDDQLQVTFDGTWHELLVPYKEVP